MNALQRAVLTAIPLALGACSLAPDYHRPGTVAAAAGFQETRDWKIAAPAAGADRGDWWTIYHDPVLDALEARVGDDNQDLKAAFAQLEEARAIVRENRAGYLPTITGSAAALHERQSTNKPFFPAGGNPGFNDDVLGADLSWQIDLFGRVRNLVAGSKARAEASAADLATLGLSIRAELASDYFALRGDDSTLASLEASIGSYRKALELTQNLYQGGAAAAVDVSQAQLQLQNAITAATDVRLQRKQLEHAIAALTGQSAASFSLAPGTLAAAIPEADPGLPSVLLERRPDVAAAERRVAAANADIGVARSAFFPVFGFSAAAGFESTSPGSWIEAPSRFWSLGPTATFNLFNPAVGALTDQSRAAYDAAVADYRQTVLVAYQEVEDSLAAVHELAGESVSAQAAATAASTALTQANYRYRGGIASYLEVVTAENAALQAQLALNNLQVRQLTASVRLIKALGGGWRSTNREAAR